MATFDGAIKELHARRVAGILQVGDWVTLNPAFRGEAWIGGHVERIDGNAIYLAYGGMQESSWSWRRGCGAPDYTGDVFYAYRRLADCSWQRII